MATRIDSIEIPHPCSASWATMDGDARARFCKLCSKVVHDTTSLTTCELEKMLNGPVAPCLRVHRDRLGRVLTRDRLAALAFVGLAACTGGMGETGGLVDTAETAYVALSGPDPAGTAPRQERALGTDPRAAVRSGRDSIAEATLPVLPAGPSPLLDQAEKKADRIASGPPPCMGKPRPILMGGVGPTRSASSEK